LQIEGKRKPGWERFGLVFGLVLAVLIPLLQANGVDVNWWESLIAYIVILLVCEWSLLWHAMPDRKRKARRTAGTLTVLTIIGSLGTFATLKQYERDYADDLALVRTSGVEVKQQKADSVYVFQIDSANLSKKDLKVDSVCMVARPNIPLAPFGITENQADINRRREFEDYLFKKFDNEENSGKASTQDLPAQQTMYSYCPSSWIASKEEIQKLEHGDLTLYVAGRKRIPSKIPGAHIDVDFCRVGDETHGLANCYGHNVPHVHR